VGPSDIRNYPPPSPSLKPSTDVLFPDPLPGGTSSRSNSPFDPASGSPVNPAKAKAAEAPSLPLLPSVPGGATTGIPGFNKVEEGLASGRKPELDGFASLKQLGYRTVIYLSSANADTTAVRDLVQKRGLEFAAIEATPERLAAARESFLAAVSDNALKPIFVFDEDGTRAGAMWYLYFRSKSMNDDAARVRAKSLGMSSQGDEGRGFELAIQQYLATH
jgi:protein tyrosine phosphatase (PTP) superfamily phosphohydrolase (DUF442 family)